MKLEVPCGLIALPKLNPKHAPVSDTTGVLPCSDRVAPEW